MAPRVNIVLKPIAIDGTALSIRRFPKEPVRMQTLIEWGSISMEVADFLKHLVCAGYNILCQEEQEAARQHF